MTDSQEYYNKYSPLFGAWTIRDILGEGSFGKVFKITRKDIGGEYSAAMKAVTIPKSTSEIRSLTEDGMSEDDVKKYFEGVVKSIVNEFALMSKLKGNSNIVSYEDHAVYAHDDGIGWDILIRMELLTALPAHIRNNSMNIKEIVKLGIDICRALEICAKYDIIHRDIKPENIFVNENGDYKLGDFGIARQIEKATARMTKTGTPNYMAPEVFNGKDYGVTADIYSLGIVLYKLLNKNRIPFLPKDPQPIKYEDYENAFQLRMHGKAPDMPDGCRDYPELGEIILKACSFNPDDRYTNASAMKEDLEYFFFSVLHSRYMKKDADIMGRSALSESTYGDNSDKGYTVTAGTADSSSKIIGKSSRLINSGQRKINLEKLDSIDNSISNDSRNELELTSLSIISEAQERQRIRKEKIKNETLKLSRVKKKNFNGTPKNPFNKK